MPPVARTLHWAGLALASLAVIALAGCTNPVTAESPTPSPVISTPASPTAEPTPSPTDPKDIAIATAKQRFLDYIATRNTISHDPSAGYDAIFDFLGSSEAINEEVDWWDSAIASGEYSTGDVQVYSMNVLDYVMPSGGATTGQQVTIDACIDSSQKTKYDASGNVIPWPSEAPLRMMSTVVWYQQPDGRWTLTSSVTDVDRPC